MCLQCIQLKAYVTEFMLFLNPLNNTHNLLNNSGNCH